VVELPFAADRCPCVEKLRTVLPLTACGGGGGGERSNDPVQEMLRQGKKPGALLFLHAHTLALAHPLTAKPLALQAPLSSFFAQVLHELRGDEEVTAGAASVGRGAGGEGTGHIDAKE
jgi:hypothetical protein